MVATKVTELAKFLELDIDRDFHVGIDVHKKSYHVAVLRSDGEVKTFVSSASPEAIVAMLLPHLRRIRAVAYEAGPTGFGLARTLAKAGFSVIVVAPSRVPRPVTAGAKTDRLDCMRLADHAARGILKSIAVPTEEEEAERSVIRRRHDLADGTRRVKQRIQSLLLFHGVEAPPGLNHWGRSAVAQLRKFRLPKEAKATLLSLLRELNFLTKEKAFMEERTSSVCEKPEHFEEMRCLRSVPGVGPITAATFLLELFRPSRFDRVEEVTSYLGLAPLVRQSGERKSRVALPPVGQTRLRSLLVEAAWTWKSRDPAIDSHYRKLLSRTGLPQKAICALARKLAVVLWRLTMEKRTYEFRLQADQA